MNPFASMRPLRGRWMRGGGGGDGGGGQEFGGDYNNVSSPLCIMLRRTVYRTFWDGLGERWKL